MTPNVSVIIVNFRTFELTKNAVESALREPEALEVIVVDNASNDSSGEQLLDAFKNDVRVKVLLEKVNKGFGFGNNVGAKAAVGEFLFLLNSDATFHSGCLSQLLATWKTLNKPGIIAPKVFLADGKSPQLDAQGIFPNLGRLLTRETKKVTDSDTPEWVSGCAFMIPKELFERVEGFDTSLFMYFEDVLMCWAIRQLGYQVYRDPKAGVTHLGGGSASSSMKKKKQYYSAQDYALSKMGVGALGLALVKILRWPNWLIGKFRHRES